MVKFIGEYASKLDDKGRVVVPAAFKNLVGKQMDGGEISFVIKKDLFANCLNMFTYEQWDQESEQVRSRLNLFRREDAAWYRETSPRFPLKRIALIWRPPLKPSISGPVWKSVLPRCTVC